jgi:hypothetical protein
MAEKAACFRLASFRSRDLQVIDVYYRHRFIIARKKSGPISEAALNRYNCFTP